MAAAGGGGETNISKYVNNFLSSNFEFSSN